MTKPNFLTIGHRGAMGYKPENTLPSFELAISMGCPWVELDVYFLHDTLLVIHDDTLERTTNGKGKLSDHPLSYLRSLDAGDGQPIPTLDEVLDMIDARISVNVELKGKGTALPTCALLESYLSANWHIEQFAISSFDHKELSACDEKFRRGALFGRRNFADPVKKALQLNAWSVNVDASLVTDSLVEDAHDNGLKVFAYTVNEPEEIVRMIECGLDGIFTNFPDRVPK